MLKHVSAFLSISIILPSFYRYVEVSGLAVVAGRGDHRAAFGFAREHTRGAVHLADVGIAGFIGEVRHAVGELRGNLHALSHADCRRILRKGDGLGRLADRDGAGLAVSVEGRGGNQRGTHRDGKEVSVFIHSDRALIARGVGNRRSGAVGDARVYRIALTRAETEDGLVEPNGVRRLLDDDVAACGLLVIGLGDNGRGADGLRRYQTADLLDRYAVLVVGIVIHLLRRRSLGNGAVEVKLLALTEHQHVLVERDAVGSVVDVDLAGRRQTVAGGDRHLGAALSHGADASVVLNAGDAGIGARPDIAGLCRCGRRRDIEHIALTQSHVDGVPVERDGFQLGSLGIVLACLCGGFLRLIDGLVFAVADGVAADVVDFGFVHRRYAAVLGAADVVIDDVAAAAGIAELHRVRDGIDDAAVGNRADLRGADLDAAVDAALDVAAADGLDDGVLTERNAVIFHLVKLVGGAADAVAAHRDGADVAETDAVAVRLDVVAENLDARNVVITLGQSAAAVLKGGVILVDHLADHGDRRAFIGRVNILDGSAVGDGVVGDHDVAVGRTDIALGDSGRGVALLRENTCGIGSLTAVEHRINRNAARRAVDDVAADFAVLPVHALNRRAAHVAEGVVADHHAVKRRVEYRGMGAHAAGTILKQTVLDQDILHRERLGTALHDVAALEDIELDRLIAHRVHIHAVILELAALDGEAVDARDFHDVTVLLVLERDVLHHKVLGVRNLDHRVLGAAAVKDAALDGDVGMCAVARRTLGFAVIIARAQHVGGRLGIAVECHAVELQDGVAVYVKCSCEVIAARLYRHAVDIALTRGITRGVQRRLNRDIGAEVLDLGRADIKLGLTADILSAVGGRERDAAESHCERAGKRGSCDFSVETSQKLTSNSFIILIKNSVKETSILL